jgi:hypothetical protein
MQSTQTDQLESSIISITSRSLCAIAPAGFAAVIGMIYTANAQETLTEPVNHWYQILETSDAKMLDVILAGNAEIELRDLEIPQTR